MAAPVPRQCFLLRSYWWMKTFQYEEDTSLLSVISTGSQNCRNFKVERDLGGLSWPSLVNKARVKFRMFSREEMRQVIWKGKQPPTPTPDGTSGRLGTPRIILRRTLRTGQRRTSKMDIHKSGSSIKVLESIPQGRIGELAGRKR